jgi:ribosomal protein L7/L12
LLFTKYLSQSFNIARNPCIRSCVERGFEAGLFEEILTLAKTNKIDAIKEIRRLFPLGLKDAKDVIEKYSNR